MDENESIYDSAESYLYMFFEETKDDEFSGEYKLLGVRYKVTPTAVMMLMEKEGFWFLQKPIELYLRLVRFIRTHKN